MHLAFVFVLLFTLATAVALIARRLKLPYTLALVFAGLALGPTHLVHPPRLDQELLYALFLPGLLFEASYHLKFEELRRNKARILALALPGVVAGMLIIASMLVLAGRSGLSTAIGFGRALVFAAIISATDPIAVVALFREIGAPRLLSVLVEGESLLNDGTAVVLFAVAMTLVGGGGSLASASLLFARVVLVGVVVGIALGFGAALIMKRSDDPMIHITLTTIAAYGSFAVAERAHGSGVLATVTAGMFCGSYAAERVMSARTRGAVESFWEYVAFAFNSIVFLLIGFIVDLRALAAEWRAVVIAYVASLVARAAIVHGVSFLLHRTRERVPWSWSAVLTWGGLRGALSMVLALALPEDFPHRETIVAMTFGVVLATLVVQGLTLSGLLRWMRIDH